MKTTGNDTEKYKRAKKKVAEIKGFYTHLTIYSLVNTFILLTAAGLFSSNGVSFDSTSWPHFISPVIWGIGLLFHGLYVFQFKSGFIRKWEERKIKEFMEKDMEELRKFDKDPD